MEACAQNGTSSGDIHAVFQPLVQQGADMSTSPPHILTIYQGRLTTAVRLVEFM